MPILLIGLVFAAVGMLLIGLALPLIRRRVAPNKVYGLRVRSTFADPWVWYEANARSGRDLLILGFAQLATAALPLILLDLRATTPAIIYLLGNVAVCSIGVAVFAVIGLRRADRLLDEHRKGTNNPPSAH